MEKNPYTSPSTVSPILESEAETIRKSYIKHEGAIRSAGFLYWLGALPFLFAGIALLISSFFSFGFEFFDPVLVSLESVWADGAVNPTVHTVAGNDELGFRFFEHPVQALKEAWSGMRRAMWAAPLALG